MTHSELLTFLELNYPEWIRDNKNLILIKSLDVQSVQAVLRLLISEINGDFTFKDRAKYFTDLYLFDIHLNKIVSGIISSKIPITEHNFKDFKSIRFFLNPPVSDDIKLIVDNLDLYGYCLSPVSLSNDQILSIRDRLHSHKFSTKGTTPLTLLGKNLFEFEASGQNPNVKFGDTYWIDDMNELAQDPFFSKLAFDPYIISIAGKYLGVPPVHVQTSVWFSFPSKNSKLNLSQNAQMFHQDKEFSKFIKVFIYLNDVGVEQGPHSYIEGSHHDELHRKGISLSQRVNDLDIENYYDKDRIKTITGPAGTILFGDTSCVHKGEPVLAGMRIMLQLEYAASLYLSPVPPFADYIDKDGLTDQYPTYYKNRMLSNYNSKQLQIFNLFQNNFPQDNRFKVKVRAYLSRLKRSLFG